MKKTFLLSTIGIFFSTSIFANPTLPAQAQDRINQRMDDQRIEDKIPSQPAQQQQSTPQSSSAEGEHGTLSITKEELAQQPELVIRAMLSALAQNNGSNIEFLLPIYHQIPERYQDPLITKWANAIVEKRKKNYRTSIELYRSIVAEQNDILPVRLQLAIALFENNETEAAEDQFEKLRSEQLPLELQELISQYLAAIANQNPWSFSGGLTYLNDPNINNAPDAGTTIGNWSAPARESGQGVGFNFNIGKKWAWGNGFFNEVRADSNGKYYWNNKKYNEYTARGSLGLGFQNANQTITLLPFMEQTWYAGGSSKSETVKRFSQASGATLESQYWFSPQWQLNTTYEYAEQRYRSRKHLNGNYHFIGGNLVYLHNAKQYWFVGANFNRTSTRDKDDSYIRRGIQAGWGQEWGWGLSTRLSVNFARKNYYAPMPIFNITQRNREYGVNASIWHRAVHYWGITPRLTWSYSKVKSNHAFYTYDKHRVFIEFSKQF